MKPNNRGQECGKIDFLAIAKIGSADAEGVFKKELTASRDAVSAAMQEQQESKKRGSGLCYDFEAIT